MSEGEIREESENLESEEGRGVVPFLQKIPFPFCIYLQDLVSTRSTPCLSLVFELGEKKGLGGLDLETYGNRGFWRA